MPRLSLAAAALALPLVFLGAGCTPSINQPPAEKQTPAGPAQGAQTVPTGGNDQAMGPARYFGNAVRGDFDGDGRTDEAHLITRSGGGSGTFFYVTATLDADGRAQAAGEVLLGDRIAPQTTGLRDGRIVVNYADRAPGEPMTARPSVGVSRYFVIKDGALTEVKGE